jgi:hypothetical protein
MLYLTGSLPAKPHLFEALRDAGAGLLITPRNFYPSKDTDAWPTAADNGCFSRDWDPLEWQEWLRGVRRDVFYAAVPDVVADHHATRGRWDEWFGYVDGLGFPPAYVIQDGQSADAVPWDEMAALFVGGSTEYKLSAEAHALVAAAKRRGLWVHMGRVNSWTRVRIAHEWGCDSVDGNYLAFGPDVNVPKLLAWIRRLNNLDHQLVMW